MIRFVALIFALLSVPVSAIQAQHQIQWQTYIDPVYGFSAQLPLGTFDVDQTRGAPGLVLREIDGRAKINLYGGPANGMTTDALKSTLSAANQATRVTYSAGGETWFVLSGFDGVNEDSIFYTKVLFSHDRQTFSAFEITFLASEKPEFEALVEQFEDNFTRPRS